MKRDLFQFVATAVFAGVKFAGIVFKKKAAGLWVFEPFLTFFDGFWVFRIFWGFLPIFGAFCQFLRFFRKNFDSNFVKFCRMSRYMVFLHVDFAWIEGAQSYWFLEKLIN